MAYKKKEIMPFFASCIICLLIFFSGCTGSNNPQTNSTASTAPVSTTPSVIANESFFNEEKTPYDKIIYGGEINGKTAYIVTITGKSFILYDGKEIGTEYDSASSPAEIGGKLAYVAVKDAKSFVVYNGTEYGERFFDVWSLGDYNGKPIYVAQKEGKSVLVFDGRETGTQYDYVWDYRIIGGRIAYTASRINETFVSGSIRPSSSEVKAVSPYGVKNVIVFDGKEVGREYLDAQDPLELDGKLVYVALKQNKKYIIVYDGKETGKEYDSITDPKVLGGRLAYSAESAGKKLIVYNGLEYGKEYDGVFGFDLVAGKLAYAAEKDKMRFIVFGGREIGKDFGGDKSPTDVKEIDGGPAFIAKRNFKYSLYYEGKKIDTKYHLIDFDSLRAEGGKVSFLATWNNAWYIVSEK
jgi:hypothetical protein